MDIVAGYSCLALFNCPYKFWDSILIGHDKMVKVRIYYTIISPVPLYIETFSFYF
jgi:hypothetical protein